MRNVVTCLAVALLAGGGAGMAQEKPASTHIMLTPPDVKWGAAPAALPKGAMFVVVSGDPGQPAPFTIRLKLPAGFKVAPHWHPTDENVTVLSGTFMVGMGEKFDEAALKAMPAGSYGLMPAEMRHFAMAKTAAVLQVHGTGPFALNYVNPADDPRNTPAAK